MKIIDILNKIADGTLEDGFTIEYRRVWYSYDKESDLLIDNFANSISHKRCIENRLNDIVILPWEQGENISDEDEYEDEYDKEEFIEYLRAINKLMEERKRKDE